MRFIHTIEYSAYQAELAENKAAIDALNAENNDLKNRLAEAGKDRAQILAIGVEGQREINRKLSDELSKVKAQLAKAIEIHKEGLIDTSKMYRSKQDSDKYVEMWFKIYMDGLNNIDSETATQEVI